MEVEKEKFLDSKAVECAAKENEYYMDIGPPPAYMDVFTISDKVPMKKLHHNRATSKVTMLDSPRKRLMFATILTCVLLMLTVLALLGFQKYVTHARQSHANMQRYQGPCNVLLPHEGGPTDESATFPSQINEDVDLTESYGYVNSRGFSSFSGSSVLHLFDKRLTVIKSNGMCLIKPMRPDLRPPQNFEQLLHDIMSGTYLPKARLSREHWFVDKPETSELVLMEKYGSRVVEHCAHVPTFQLIPRSVIEQRLMRQLFGMECPYYKCREECEEGTARQVDVMGCLKDCQCKPIPEKSLVSGGKICTKLTPNNCPFACDSYALSLHNGCPICRCDQVASKRKRRSAMASSTVFDYVDQCKVSMQVFEGLLAGDPQELATVDYVHQCSL